MRRKTRAITGLAVVLVLAVVAVAVYSYRGRVVEEWYLWKMGSIDVAVRDRAAVALGEMGSRRGLLLVVADFAGREDRMSSGSRKALAHYGQDAILPLLETLLSASEEERWQKKLYPDTDEVLRRDIGHPTAPSLIPRLIELIASPHGEIVDRYLLARIIHAHLLRARMHPAWTALPNRLRSSTGEAPVSGRNRSGALPDGRLRTLATVRMNNPGLGMEFRLYPFRAEGIPSVFDALKSENPEISRVAMKFLGRGYVRPRATSALPEMTRLLSDENEERRFRAASVATWMYDASRDGAVAEEFVELLLERLRVETATRVRAPLIRSLGVILYRRHPGDAIVPTLIPLLRDPDPAIRFAAAGAVPFPDDIDLPEHKVAVLGGLVDLVSDPDLEVGDMALGRMSQNGHKFDMSLLGEVRTAEFVDTILDIANGKTRSHESIYSGQSVRLDAVEALGALRRKASKAIPDLIRLAAESELEYMKPYAVDAIGYVASPGDPVAINALVSASRDEDEWVRGSALWDLGEIGGGSALAMSALSDCLDREDSLKSRAIVSIGKFGASAKHLLPKVIRVYEKERDGGGIAESCIEAMPRLDAQDPRVRGLLRQALDDFDETLREKSIQAIGDHYEEAGTWVGLL